MARQCLNRRIDSIEMMRQEVSAWQVRRISVELAVDWQFTTVDTRIRLKRLYPIFDS